jgi:hypothetical protein
MVASGWLAGQGADGLISDTSQTETARAWVRFESPRRPTKKPRARVGSTAGQVLARLGRGKLSALFTTLGRSGGAPQQSSETTYASARQAGNPARVGVSEAWREARSGLGGVKQARLWLKQGSSGIVPLPEAVLLLA